jgi:glucosamine--fructose-6-phosphate aminotransferase (isomerizing)
MLSVALERSTERLAALYALPVLIEEVLAQTGTIETMAQRYRYMEQCVVLGRGYNYATAFEWALKLKELTYVVAQPYSSADFRHGPIAVVEQGFPVMAVAPQGEVFGDMMGLMRGLAEERKAELVVVSNDEDALTLAKTPMPIPELEEWLSPMVSIIPAQVFTMHLTLARGLDTERPRGLHKVTRTE